MWPLSGSQKGIDKVRTIKYGQPGFFSLA